MVSSSSLRLIYSSSHGGYPWGWDSGTVTSLSSGGSGEYNLTPTVVSLEHGACLDVVPDTRGLAVEALREAGRGVSEAGLFAAARRGDDGLCTLYLDAGVPIDCRDGDGWTPLHHSCRHGHLSLATLLLDRGSGAIDAKDSCGWTPLHLSCLHGHLSFATLLLDRGSAIDAKGRYDCTPLHLSCLDGHLSLATLLLDRGCDVDVEAHLRWQRRHDCCLRAVEAYPEAVLELLVSRGHDVRPRSLCARIWSRIRG